MTRLRTLWVLPHRDQSGHDNVIEDGRSGRLTDVLAVEDLPKELVLGIPPSVLKNHPEDDIVFAQYCRQPDKSRDLFALSVRSGVDRDGRTVYLTLLEILPSDTSKEFRVIPHGVGLPEDEQSRVGELAARRANDHDKWMKSVSKMLENVHRRTKLRTFANVAVPGAYFPYDWVPRKQARRAWQCIAVGVVVLVGLLVLVLLLRGCHHQMYLNGTFGF